MLFDRRRPVKTILPEELESDEFEFPEITESCIQDKSKGDALSKGIVIFLQIIACGVEVPPTHAMICIVEGLPGTELSKCKGYKL